MKRFIKTIEFIGNLICGIYLSICAAAFIVILLPVFIQLINENHSFIEKVSNLLIK